VVTVATAAATGVGIALPLITAGSAQAASVGTWDRVAACETGGQWSADTGNGFYGGLAMTQDTWDQYGGRSYAERPDLATEDQQIAVAEKVLADLGPGAWPGCEVATGLLVDHSTPKIDTSATPVPDPSGPTGIQPGPTSSPSPSGTPSATSSPTPAPTSSAPATGSTDPTPLGTPSATPTTPTTSTTDGVTDPAPGQVDGAPVTGVPQPTTTPSGSGASSTGSGRHGKPYDPTADELAAQDQATRTEVYSTADPDTTATPSTSANQGNSDKSSTTGENGAGGSLADASGAKGGSSDTTTQGNAGTYTVGAGDSLSGIASAEHVGGGWRQLYAANQQVIGDDPNLIKPGQILDLG
jgi:hypothetical protein